MPLTTKKTHARSENSIIGHIHGTKNSCLPHDLSDISSAFFNADFCREKRKKKQTLRTFMASFSRRENCFKSADDSHFLIRTESTSIGQFLLHHWFLKFIDRHLFGSIHFACICLSQIRCLCFGLNLILVHHHRQRHIHSLMSAPYSYRPSSRFEYSFGYLLPGYLPRVFGRIGTWSLVRNYSLLKNHIKSSSSMS